MRHYSTLTGRLISLWDHLGLQAAHAATQMPVNLAGLASSNPERIAGLLLHEPTGFDPGAFKAVAPRMVILAGDGGTSAPSAASASAALPESRRITLTGYAEPPWADHVRDHTDTIVQALMSLSGEAFVPNLKPGSGLHAGITYDIQGAGPALILSPLFLAPTQWDAALPALVAHFTVIQLGGAYLGGTALLEDRARSQSYSGMVRMMHDIMDPGPGETMLEVGCGSGALARIAATRNGIGMVTAADLNQYLLREAAALAEQTGLASRIDFREANAERLPFADASFDHAYSVTVLEECHADLALRELWRVVKPGGRVGVIVRAIDSRHYWHADLPEPIRQKVEGVSPTVAPHGIADASLYHRMRSAGFETLTCFPSTPSFGAPFGEWWSFMIGRVEPRLDAAELRAFREALRAANEARTLFGTFPHHCAVGVKPAASSEAIIITPPR